MTRRRRRLLLGLTVLLAAAAVAQWRSGAVLRRARLVLSFGGPPVVLIAHPRTAGERIVNGAKQEVLREVRYDASYRALPYPGGDVPADRGACTEVVIRGLRSAGCDLQRLIHEDMTRDFAAYPKQWGLRAPDPNIDHRRVPNHLVFLRRHGRSLPTGTTGAAAASWQPGDLVYWRFRSGETHCGVISNDRGRRGLPLILHNAGPVASQEDCLDTWPVIGHFRYPPGRRIADSR